MFEEGQGPIESLVHLYIDGAFSRRDLIRRVAAHTGSAATAVAALAGYGILHAQSASTCAADARVPADAPDLVVADVQFPGDAGTVFGHLAYPSDTTRMPWPGVIVIHENRGLVEHIKDVTRRAARAGFVALGVDLLSRQGGTQQFTDPVSQMMAYSRTTPYERTSDLIAGLTYLKALDVAQFDHIGTVGFCAGGGNAWNLAVALEELKATVVFYGTPIPTADDLARIKSPVLAMYAELDRNLTLQTPAVITTMIGQQKTFGFAIYQGAGHAFHNDTGPNYNPAAACDAWSRTLAWFNQFLVTPAA